VIEEIQPIFKAECALNELSFRDMISGITNDTLYSAVKIRSFFMKEDETLEHRPGTAFFTLNKAGKICLITNRHMLDYYYKQPYGDYPKVVLSGIQVDTKITDKTTGLPGHNSPMLIHAEGSNIQFHKEYQNDIAAVVDVKAENIDAPTVLSINIYVPYDMIAGEEYFNTNLTVCDFVAFAGFPEWHDKKDNRPLFRVGTIASDPRFPYKYPPKIQGDCILYEAFSTGGTSGSPVFSFAKAVDMSKPNTYLNYRPMLIGVNAGHIPKAIPTYLPGDLVHSGLSYFYKSSLIFDLIDTID
jgi:hypothetical protein